jgi:Winged helix-turn helix
MVRDLVICGWAYLSLLPSSAVQAAQSPTAVARELGLYTTRVFVWLAAYRAGGWGALRARKASGRPKRLTGSQLRWIYNTAGSLFANEMLFVSVRKENVLISMAVPDDASLSNSMALWSEDRPKRVA